MSDKAGELQNILEKPYVKCILYAHDKIGVKKVFRFLTRLTEKIYNWIFFHTVAEKLPDVEPSTSFSSNGLNHCGKEILGLKETPLDKGTANLRIIKLIKDGDHPLVIVDLTKEVCVLSVETKVSSNV